MSGLTDPAVQAVIRAATWRLQQVLTEAMNVEYRALLAEGHADAVVVLAAGNAASALLADLLIQRVLPSGRAKMAEGVTAWIITQVQDGLTTAPAGSLLQ